MAFPAANVLLQGWKGKERLLAVAHGLFPIGAVQQVAGDAVLLQQDGDGLLGVVGRILRRFAKADTNASFLKLQANGTFNDALDSGGFVQ